MDASATGRLEWCTTVCSLVLIAISLFLFIIFCKCRPFAEVGCGVRLTAVQLPITRESQTWDFSVSKAADAVSREVECVLTWP